MRRRKTSDWFADVPLFADCTKAELSRIASLATSTKVRAGTPLTREGAPGREFFVLVEGKAKVSKRGRTITMLGPGDFFGEMSLLDMEPRSATVTAETDITVLALNPREFTALLDSTPRIARKLLRAMAQRLRDADPKPTH